MGTTLHCSVNPLAALLENNAIDAVNYKDSWEFVAKNFLKNRITSPNHFRDSMDRMLEHYNKETLKKTMIKHEEIFKEQVRELHRLYKVQKMLMAELKNSESKPHARTNPSPQVVRVGANCVATTDSPNVFWSIGTTSETNHHFNKTTSGYNFHQPCTLRANPNPQEQSTTYPRDSSSIRFGIDLEQPAEENISPTEGQQQPNSQRSLRDKMTISSPCLYTEGDSEVELTLSIGFGTNKKKPKSHQPHSSAESGSNERTQKDLLMSIRSDRGEECSDPTNSSSPAKQPPWLFQTLSLNRT